MKANLLPAIVTAIICFVMFRSLYYRWANPLARAALIFVSLILATPAVLFASNYVLSLPYAPWFIEAHAIPGAEIGSGCIAALLGVMFSSAKLRPNPLNRPLLIICTILVSLLVFTPFLKQLISHSDYTAQKESWKDGVCMQSTDHTCLPACSATVIHLLGGQVSEQEIARAAGTSNSGTESWYFLRTIRKRGYDAHFSCLTSLRDAPVPSIVGVWVGNIGHVVVLLKKDQQTVTVGDPLLGRKDRTWESFEKRYKPTGTCMTIYRRR